MDKKKKANAFFKGFRIYMIVLGLILVGLLVALWVAMWRYQKKVDAKEAVKTGAQNYFDTYADPSNAKTWADAYLAQNSGDADVITSDMATLLSSDSVEKWRGEDYSDEVPTFVLSDANGKIAKVVLESTEDAWTVASMEFYVTADKSGSVEALDGQVVTCNGIVLGEDAITEHATAFPIEDYVEDLENPVEKVTYEVTGRLVEPEFTVTDSADQTTAEDAEGNQVVLCADGEADAYIDEAEQFTKDLLYYYMMGSTDMEAHLATVLADVVPKSQAYNLLQSSGTSVSWRMAASGLKIKTEPSTMLHWADNCFSIDVTYTATSNSTTENGNAAGTYRTYFLDLGDGYKIYAFALD